MVSRLPHQTPFGKDYFPLIWTWKKFILPKLEKNFHASMVSQLPHQTPLGKDHFPLTWTWTLTFLLHMGLRKILLATWT